MEVVEAQKESNRMFLELEEKRMKHEAEPKKGVRILTKNDVSKTRIQSSHDARLLQPCLPAF